MRKELWNNCMVLSFHLFNGNEPVSITFGLWELKSKQHPEISLGRTLS